MCGAKNQTWKELWGRKIPAETEYVRISGLNKFDFENVWFKLQRKRAEARLELRGSGMNSANAVRNLATARSPTFYSKPSRPLFNDRDRSHPQ